MNTTSPFSENSNQAHCLYLVRHSAKLLMFCLLGQLPFAIWLAPYVSGLALLNLALHTIALLLVLLLCNRGKLLQARICLNLSFGSYILIAVSIWGGELFVQHFLLLGVVTCAMLYSSREIRQQITLSISFATGFVLVEAYMCWPLNNWHQIVRFCNALTLAAGATILSGSIIHNTQRRWHYLKMVNQQSRELLTKIIPSHPARPGQLWQPGETQRIDFATVLFADFVGYTSLSDYFDDDQIVEMLDALYREFDSLATQLGIEKIKTNGDEYMAVASKHTIHVQHHSHPATQMCRFALRMQQSFNAFCLTFTLPCQLRIGIASGSVTAGIIGKHKPSYDIWGKTVNLAARLEQSSGPGNIRCCARTHAAVLRDKAAAHMTFVCVESGKNAAIFECRANASYTVQQT
ncbi:adenylate/guanylate cyclase domain-containing protein [Alteromonas aestuariivivens]|uniref:Adenylate/guanylate cyclase domain-containing protein n=1 Tax=Alteromonas aestuariivivens TaxID=1938339 RepID=A0A3D8M8F5_9ALTE|nr:adenylate/guanylate cyclase domain-containing protein [Alteromonas aestuariivivens]RDV26175.1 adenylate/guanylate cyclase domain-containing protein [Alteromonas aestuariivivens]